MTTANTTGKNYLSLKVVLNGDSGVGKSSLVESMMRGVFNPNNIPTVGAAFYTKLFDVDNYKIKMEIWDTAGQERFKSLSSMYYNGSMGCFCVFSVMDAHTFEHITDWMNQFDKVNRNIGDTVIFIVANQTDYDETKWAVTRESIEKLGNISGCRIIYTTAKNSDDVRQMFVEIINEIIKKNPQVTNYNSNYTNINQRLHIKTIASPTTQDKQPSCSC